MILLENSKIRVAIAEDTGAVSSFYVKKSRSEFISEKSLIANFRLCVPLEGYMCNYIEGMEHTPSSVKTEGTAAEICFRGLSSPKGYFDIELVYTITLEDDRVIFKSSVTNHSDYKISEFWFPRIGGWTEAFSNRDANLAIPGYLSCRHEISLFRQYPGRMGLGAEAAEFATDYPGMMMPWWDIYEESANLGLYLGYHDKTFRYSTWHTYLYPNVCAKAGDAWMNRDESGGKPVGLVFSHVRYPFIGQGECCDTGEFILRVHEGDWHTGALFYRDWFLKNFPFDKSSSWLRKESAWFSSILYQPEDKIVADYEEYDQWCKDAGEFGIHCHELLGWDKGGIERYYPEYVPEAKLGGEEGFGKLLDSIGSRGDKCLVFVNYNIVDGASHWFKEELRKYQHQDEFGQTPNWMAWGESTLIARKGISVRRHLLASVVPEFEDILHRYFLKIAEAGASGLQIDKLCVGSVLDFNPLNEEKPDVALCEGLVRSIGKLLEKCRKINPDFCLAAEAVQDRLIPYIDVYYRNSNVQDISPLRYVFPEWTSCQHIGIPYDFNGINGAVLTGSVLCVEPEAYQSTLMNPMWRQTAFYIKEVERIRKELFDILFLGEYFDDTGAAVNEVQQMKSEGTEIEERKLGGEVMLPGGYLTKGAPNKGSVKYGVHGSRKGIRAIVVMNVSGNSTTYSWKFLHRAVEKAKLYTPFEPVKTVDVHEFLEIKAQGLHILLESPLTE